MPTGSGRSSSPRGMQVGVEAVERRRRDVDEARAARPGRLQRVQRTLDVDADRPRRVGGAVGLADQRRGVDDRLGPGRVGGGPDAVGVEEVGLDHRDGADAVARVERARPTVEPDDGVAGAREAGGDERADEAARAGDQDPHAAPLLHLLRIPTDADASEPRVGGGAARTVPRARVPRRAARGDPDQPLAAGVIRGRIGGDPWRPAAARRPAGPRRAGISESQGGSSMHALTDLRVPAGRVAVHWFEQSSFAVKDAAGTVVQIDPYFPRVRPPERFIHPTPPLDEAELPTDYVLLDARPRRPHLSGVDRAHPGDRSSLSVRRPGGEHRQDRRRGRGRSKANDCDPGG